MSDSDVANLRAGEVPFIKPHGTISNPETLCIATDEVFDFTERSPILSMYLSSMLANKNVLFMGFGLADVDFISLVRYLKRHLGVYMPKSYAIVKGKTTFLDRFWHEHNVEVIDCDATLFLEELHKEIGKRQIAKLGLKEPWMRNEIFYEFLEYPSTPTETQVIEVLVRRVSEAININFGSYDLESKVSTAIEMALKYRPNYTALRKIKDLLNELFNDEREDMKSAQDKILELEKKYEQIRERIQEKSSEILNEVTSVLVYSQSQRVADILTALPKKRQSGVKVFILECRTKSSELFQEAIAITKLLRETDFEIVLVPDLVGLKLIKENNVDLVLLGAHSVIIDTDESHVAFVNRCLRL